MAKGRGRWVWRDEEGVGHARSSEEGQMYLRMEDVSVGKETWRGGAERGGVEDVWGCTFAEEQLLEG